MSDVEVLGLHLSGGLVPFWVVAASWAIFVVRARSRAKAGIRRRAAEAQLRAVVARAVLAADGITRWVAYGVAVLCAYAGASAFEAVQGPGRWVLLVVALAAGAITVMFAVSDGRAARRERQGL